MVCCDRVALYWPEVALFGPKFGLMDSSNSKGDTCYCWTNNIDGKRQKTPIVCQKLLHFHDKFSYPPCVPSSSVMFSRCHNILSPGREVLSHIKYSDSSNNSRELIMEHIFSKHRPSGPMLSISQNVRPSVCPYVCLSVHF